MSGEVNPDLSKRISHDQHIIEDNIVRFPDSKILSSENLQGL
jgi:hypothetical protein